MPRLVDTKLRTPPITPSIVFSSAILSNIVPVAANKPPKENPNPFMKDSCAASGKFILKIISCLDPFAQNTTRHKRMLL